MWQKDASVAANVAKNGALVGRKGESLKTSEKTVGNR
jgi:hypothetical protein